MTTILAIDDREDNLISLSAILKSLVPGCTLITAQSGPEGIEKAKTELPDTILLDIKMPGMDGYETCKRLKANKDTEHIPVIMISAIMTGSQDLIKGLDTGADAYLAKPIDEHVLIAQIKTALRMKSAEDALRRQKDILENLVQERTVQLTHSNTQLRREIDERKQAEASLQERESLYRDMFEKNKAIKLLVDLDSGKIVDANSAACNFYQYSPNEIKKLNIWDINTLSQAETKEKMAMAAEGKKSDFLFHHRLASGEIRDVLVYSGLIETRLKNLLYSIVLDITEQKNAEKNLAKYQNLLKKSQELGKIGTWELDINKNKLIWTEENHKIFGLPLGTELTYEIFLNRLHPDDREYVDLEWKSALAGEPYDIEHRLLVDGNTKWVRQKAEVEFDENGNAIRGTGFTQDITDRKQAQKKLDKAVEDALILKKAIDQIPVGVALADENFQLYFCNAAGLGLRGGDVKNLVVIPREAYGNWQVLRLDGNPYDTQDLPLVRTIREKKVIKEEFIVRHEDGSDHICDATASPILDEHNRILGGLIVFPDISDQKKIGRQLQQSQKMEAIGTLAGGIAHDFNNILFPIVGYTQMLLEDTPEDSPTRDSLNQIYTSVLRAKSLVKQILTFSRQESSELMLMKMQPIIKETLKLIRSTIPTTIDIKLDINPDCGVIKADPTQIHQIVMNLATNAYHAMEETGGELKVRLKEIELGEYDILRPDMKPGIYACLTITDTGIGMDKELTRKVFDPFFTTKKKGKGTGMGLSVVHGIVTAMGGAIQVYSEPGEGTQFHVYLPVEKNFSEEQVIHSKIDIQGGTEQILLVDDDESILLMEKRMLELLGYQVTTHISSIEALEAFRDSPDKFDIVITDMAMPNMPGDKLSAELIKIRYDIPILLCTGFSETMSEEKATSLGIKGFLWKPIIMKDLAQKIREVLDKK